MAADVMLLLDASGNYGYLYSHIPRRFDITAYSVADAKNRLPSLIDKALAGEEVIITRRGKPVVEVRPASPRAAGATGTHEWLRARTCARPGVGLTSVELLDLIYKSKED